MINWINGLKEDNIQKTPKGWMICFAPRTVKFFDEETGSYTFGDQWLSKFSPKKPYLEDIKEALCDAISEYDSSEEVNGFKIGNEIFWIDKATRVGLRNSISIEVEHGKTETELWLGSRKIVLSCQKALELLKSIELYAIDCYRVTQQHLFEVSELTLENIFEYDITRDYPEMLTLEF